MNYAEFSFKCKTIFLVVVLEKIMKIQYIHKQMRFDQNLNVAIIIIRYVQSFIKKLLFLCSACLPRYYSDIGLTFTYANFTIYY